jgi:hypothetical protein
LAGLYIDGIQAAGLELYLEIPRLIAYFLNNYFIKINNAVGWAKVSKSIGIVGGGLAGGPSVNKRPVFLRQPITGG